MTSGQRAAAVRAHNQRRRRSLFASHTREDLAASETHDGHNGIRDHYRDLFTGFPDFAFETVRKHATDEAVVLEVVVTGTHAATWKGIPATGKAVRFPLCAVFTFASGDVPVRGVGVRDASTHAIRWRSVPVVHRLSASAWADPGNRSNTIRHARVRMMRSWV